ncbi:MAG: 4-hydroxy-2-oxovalerate aldolase [Candidatus Cloacimonetes bacterium]|nr:4-hydroxy-2-oxovalerate aldolase [Candidatus Cloacimonadota bacterium]
MEQIILETTLRDGSYAIDFRFTPEDTALIALALEQAGFRYIEIGHGMGLNATNMGKGELPAPDVAYIEAVRSRMTTAKIGMFCIPGLAKPQHIADAASAGLDFVRIGTNITDLPGKQAFFSTAKKHGLYISANLMKSYAVKPDKFVYYTALAQEYGADVAVLVDSAGGFVPDDIEAYFQASQAGCDIGLGFHGHNNLGLANANSLKAWQLGAAVVDCSLKGLGRSAGNAATEMLVALFERLGYNTGIDKYAVMDIAEEHITPLLHNVRNTPASVTGGYAWFHSSFSKMINRYARKFKIDSRELIVRLTSEDVVNPSEELVRQVAEHLSREKTHIRALRLEGSVLIEFMKAKQEERLANQFEVLTREVINRSRKTGKPAVMNIVQSLSDKSAISANIQENPFSIIGNMEIASPEDLTDIADSINKQYDWILLDTGLYGNRSREFVRTMIAQFDASKLIQYNDIDTWTKSIVDTLAVLLNGIVGRNILLWGDNLLTKVLSAILRYSGASVFFRTGHDGNPAQQLDAIISCSLTDMLPLSFLEKSKLPQVVIDARIGSITSEAMDHLHQQELLILRPDMRGIIAGEIVRGSIDMWRLRHDIHRRQVDGTNIISGGVIGSKGEFVVDSVSQPTIVLGVATGDGHVRYNLTDPELEIAAWIKAEFPALRVEK